MRLRSLLLLPVLFAVAAAGTGCVSVSGETPEEERNYIRSVRDEILTEAYANYPGLDQQIRNAPAYGVLNTGTFKLFVVGTAKGYGMVVENATGREVFTSHFGIALGLGIEFSTARAVIVIEDEATLRALEEGGWDFGGELAAAFKFGDFGGSAQAGGPGGAITAYPLFQNGVALHASVYWLNLGGDEDLN